MLIRVTKEKGLPVGTLLTLMKLSCLFLVSECSLAAEADWCLLGQQNQTNPECWFTIHLLPSLPRWNLFVSPMSSSVWKQCGGYYNTAV